MNYKNIPLALESCARRLPMKVIHAKLFSYVVLAISDDISSFRLVEEQLFPLDMVMKTSVLTNYGNAKVSIAVPKDEANLWFDSLSMHHSSLDKNISADKIFEILNSHQYENDIDQKIVAASMQITLKGQQHILHVHPYDDVTIIANNFIEENELKPEYVQRIESELLRTQIDACHLYESALVRKLAYLKRNAIKIFIAEQRRDLAEEHALKLDQTALKIEGLTLSVDHDLKAYRQSISQYQDEIAQLKNDLATSYSENIELQDKLDYTEQSLQKKIKSLNQSLKDLQEQLDGDADDDSTVNAADHSKSPGKHRYGRQVISVGSKTSPRVSESKSSMRKEKALLRKKIVDLQEENKKYAHDLREEINKRHSLQLLGLAANAKAEGNIASSQLVDGQDVSSELVSRTKRAEERYRLLRSKLTIIEDAKDLQNKKIDDQVQTIAKLNDNLCQQESEIARLNEELKTFHDKLLIENVMKLEAENKQQAEELMGYRMRRSNIVTSFNDLRDALAHALQYLQMLEPQQYMLEAIKSWRELLSAAASLPLDDFHPQSKQAENLNPELSMSAMSSSTGKKRRGSSKNRKSIGEGSRVAFEEDHMKGSGFTEVDDHHQTPLNVSISIDLSQQSATIQPQSSSHSSVAGTLSSSEKLYSRAEMIFHHLSPVVEDRLLRDIYARYNIADNGTRSSTAVITLTRYIRFAREFAFISSNGKASSGNYLVPGEVDMVFFNASNYQVDPSERDNPKPPPARPFSVKNHYVSYTGLLSIYPSNESLFLAHEAAAEAASDADSTSFAGFQRTAMVSSRSEGLKFQPISSTTVVTERQFIASIEQLAIKVYWRDIEKKYGTVYDCLPPSEKPSAARFAMELVLVKKIIPMADKLDLIPWALIYFDQALTSISKQQANYQFLASLQMHLLTWFNHYVSNFDLMSAEPLYDLSSADASASESKDANHFFRTPSKSYSKTLSSSQRSANSAINKEILGYKLLSRFGREFGIVPYLMKEPQLFR
jgi:hypothetical protein